MPKNGLPSSLIWLDHPLLKIHLAELRDESANSSAFRLNLHSAARVLAMETARHLTTSPSKVRTPLEETDGFEWRYPLVLVPILRAGLGFLHGFLDILPHAQVGHIGLARNEKTLQPESYYTRLPSEIDQAEVVLLDPMLATGGSSVAALDLLRSKGAKKIIFSCLLAAPEGIHLVAKAHPGITILTASVDRELDSSGFILPGLGDAGDRYFGTL